MFKERSTGYGKKAFGKLAALLTIAGAAAAGISYPDEIPVFLTRSWMKISTILRMRTKPKCRTVP